MTEPDPMAEARALLVQHDDLFALGAFEGNVIELRVGVVRALLAALDAQQQTIAYLRTLVQPGLLPHRFVVGVDEASCDLCGGWIDEQQHHTQEAVSSPSQPPGATEDA